MDIIAQTEPDSNDYEYIPTFDYKTFKTLPERKPTNSPMTDEQWQTFKSKERELLNKLTQKRHTNTEDNGTSTTENLNADTTHVPSVPQPNVSVVDVLGGVGSGEEKKNLSSVGSVCYVGTLAGSSLPSSRALKVSPSSKSGGVLAGNWREVGGVLAEWW